MIPKNIKISSIRQEKALGLGDAILNAKHLLNQEPFAIFLPDELLISRNKDSSFYKMMNHWDNTNQGQIMVQKINKKLSKSYGIVDLNNKKIKINETQEIKRLVEKPNPVDSPSNYRVVGRYILPYEIMEMLESTNLGKDNEIQLTDALDNLLKNTKLRAFLTDDDIFDCGEIKGFIGANVAIASKDRDLKRYMEDIIN
jgi:UTP--glucose-1-phosphate uridylyltransferase